MPKYRVTGPDGSTYEVTAPDGASEQEVMDYVKQNMQAPVPKGPPTLQQRAQEVYGFDPDVRRSALLPFGEKGGKTVPAMPQVGVDILSSALLPGHVKQGGSYTPEDATKFALDIAAPATSKAMRSATKPKGQIIKEAPATEDLATQGGRMFQSARDSGITLDPDDYVNFLSDVENAVSGELDSMLHPKAFAALNAAIKRIGKDLTLQDLQIIRRQMGVATRSTTPELADERRIASIMMDKLDDVVEGLSSLPREARRVWARAKKSQTIEDAIEAAKTQASGFENGLRIQFRQILRSPKKSRGFSPDELKAMKQVANGDASQWALRILGILGFGTTGSQPNIVGAGIGSYLGAAVGGPYGAAAVPLLGHGAKRVAESRAHRNAQLARALAATGGKMPRPETRLQGLMALSTAPLLGTQLEPTQVNKLADALR